MELTVGAFDYKLVPFVPDIAHNDDNMLYAGEDAHGLLIIVKTSTSIDEEVRVLARAQMHPNIIAPLKLHGLHKHLAVKRYRMCLREYVNSPESHLITDTNRAAILSAVAAACSHLVSRQLVHGDIRPDNIFLTDTTDIVLGDFGYCQRARHARKHALCDIDSYCIHNGQWLQSIDGNTLFASDMFGFVVTIVTAVFGITYGRIPRGDILVTDGQKTIDVASCFDQSILVNYAAAVSDMMFTSPVVDGRINPLVVPVAPAAFIEKVMVPRIGGTSRIIVGLLMQMLKFPRTNDMTSALQGWCRVARICVAPDRWT